MPQISINEDSILLALRQITPPLFRIVTSVQQGQVTADINTYLDENSIDFDRFHAEARLKQSGLFAGIRDLIEASHLSPESVDETSAFSPSMDMVEAASNGVGEAFTVNHGKASPSGANPRNKNPCENCKDQRKGVRQYILLIYH